MNSNDTVEVIVTDPFGSVREFRIIMNSVGAVLSFLGYGIMVATAILFPTWRKIKQNQLWLHMCGSFIVYFCSHFFTFLRPIQNPHISVVVEHLNRYLVRVSLCWMLAGAWLTYKNLVDVFFDVGDDFIKNAAIFSYVTPMPFVLAMYVIYIYQHDINEEISVGCSYDPNNFDSGDVYRILTCFCENSLLFVPIVGSLALYICVTISICKNRKVYGQQRDLFGTVALGFYFVFTCCVQCAIISVKFIFSLSGVWSYIAIVLMSFHVSTYTVFFVFCNKMTRELWSRYLKSKISGGMQTNATSSGKSVAVQMTPA